MDNFYADIGRRMKTVRLALKLTQAQVAEAAGIDTSFYGQIERGSNVPSLKTFTAIARALKTEPSSLLPGRSGGGERLYENTIGNLLTNLDPRKKAAVLGIVRDIVNSYRNR